MTVYVDIDPPDADLARTIRELKRGEHLVFERAGQPVLRAAPTPPRLTEPRKLGLGADLFKVPPDFDAPLPDEVLDLFEGR